jgi:hypothetical protein
MMCPTDGRSGIRIASSEALLPIVPECSDVFDQITNLLFRQSSVQESVRIGLVALPLSSAA